MSFKERGHFPNTLRFRPVKYIITSVSGFKICRGSTAIFYSWKDVEDAFIEKKLTVKGLVGSAATVDMEKRTFVLQTGIEKYKFDVSHCFPDFHNSDELMSILTSNLTVREVRVRPGNGEFFNAFLIVFSVVTLFLLKDC